MPHAISCEFSIVTVLLSYTVFNTLSFILAASSLDPSGFIALRALTQTVRCTTGPSSALYEQATDILKQLLLLRADTCHHALQPAAMCRPSLTADKWLMACATLLRAAPAVTDTFLISLRVFIVVGYQNSKRTWPWLLPLSRPFCVNITQTSKARFISVNLSSVHFVFVTDFNNGVYYWCCCCCCCYCYRLHAV